MEEAKFITEEKMLSGSRFFLVFIGFQVFLASHLVPPTVA
jgi:hypothetical protein